MNKKQYLLLLFATIISGLLGGAGFSWLSSGQTVSAQNNSPKVVSAQEFRLVDANGNLRAILSDDPTLARGTPSLLFYDRNQNNRELIPRIAIGQYSMPAPSIQLMDEKGSEAFSLTRFHGTTTLQLNNISEKTLAGGTIVRSGNPAVVLSENAENGANVEVFGKSSKLVWAARK